MKQISTSCKRNFSQMWAKHPAVGCVGVCMCVLKNAYSWTLPWIH